MLNTDLHNSNVQRKMSESQFLENMQYSGGEPLSPDYLRGLYQRILREPIQFKEVDRLYPDAMKQIQANLRSKGGKWHRRHLLLTPDHLIILRKYDPTEERGNCLFSIPLARCTLGWIGKEKDKQYCLRLYIHPSDETTSFLLVSFASAVQLHAWSLALQRETTLWCV